jgi:molybdopterin-guanine dinucleotide biosynthesis protein A
VGGRRIIDRVADALSTLAIDANDDDESVDATRQLLVVSNSPDAATWLPHARVVTDVRPEHGSLVGLHAALVQARDTVFALAWDMPFVTRDLVRLVARSATDTEFAAVPIGTHGAEPFCAVYRPACLPYIDAALDRGDFRLSALLERLPAVTFVSVDDVRTVGDPARLFFNVNDAADLSRADRLAAG